MSCDSAKRRGDHLINIKIIDTDQNTFLNQLIKQRFHPSNSGKRAEVSTKDREEKKMD